MQNVFTQGLVQESVYPTATITCSKKPGPQSTRAAPAQVVDSTEAAPAPRAQVEGSPGPRAQSGTISLHIPYHHIKKSELNTVQPNTATKGRDPISGGSSTTETTPASGEDNKPGIKPGKANGNVSKSQIVTVSKVFEHSFGSQTLIPDGAAVTISGVRVISRLRK